MAIYKAPHHQPFTQIPNSTLQDISISFEAKGLLCLILSLPEDWEIHKIWLRKQAPKCGRDKLDKCLKELQEQGYMRKKLKRAENGKLEGYDWYVYSEKTLEANEINTSTGTLKNRIPVKPDSGKPATTNKHINKKKISSSKPASPDCDFELLFLFVLTQLQNECFDFVDGDENVIRAKLGDYVAWCLDNNRRPGKGGALDFVRNGLAMACQSKKRTARLSVARDKLADANANRLEAQAAAVHQQACELVPGTTADRFDRSWDD